MEAWKKMRRLDRRNFAMSELARDIDKGVGVAGDAWTSVGVNKIIKGIRSARAKAAMGNKSERLWTNSFDPGELNQIEQLLKDIKKDLPALPPGQGVITGSSQRAKMGAAGEVIGESLGIGKGTGAALGILSTDLIAQAMMSDAGRTMVRSAMKIDPAVGPVFRNTLATFLRMQTQQARGEPPVELAAPPPLPAPGPSPQPTPGPTAEQRMAARKIQKADADRRTEQREAATR